jgi:hypothetical protein
MLERLVESTKTGDVGLGLNDSSNSIFAENGAVEKSLEKSVNFVYDSLYGNRNTSEMSDKEKAARLVAAHSLIGTIGTAYVLAESVCRGSEFIGRGTVELLGKAGNLAYDKLEFVESTTEKIKEAYNQLQMKVSRPIKKKIGRFFQRFKDQLIIGASIATLALSYGGIKSCNEEPTAIVEPERDYKNPIDSITDLFEEPQEEERVQRPTPRTVEPPRPVIQQSRRAPERVTPQCINTSSRSAYQSVANAAKERAVSQRNNYAFDNAPTSPLVGLTSNTNPGETEISWLRNRNKCNQFVGDALVQAGYKVPTNVMRDGSLHYKAIEQFPEEEAFFERVTDFCDIKPGHVLVIDHPMTGESTAHGEIIADVNYQTGRIKSFGAHEDGAYKKTFDIFKDANFDGVLECWQLGMDNIYVLKPK